MKDMMQLSTKAIWFIIEAPEHHLTYHEERLRDASWTEDESAALANDCQYLAAIKTDLQKYHDELMRKFSSHTKVGWERAST